MSKTAFIFPGQGVQKAGMGKDFYENSEVARYIYDTATEALQLDMRKLCFEENAKLDRTEYTQAALVATCLAMARVLESKGIRPDVTAGLSLGEYCAVAMAGGINDQDAIMAVRQRGILMQEAVPLGVGAMAAILGMSGEAVEAVLEEIPDVFVANYNCPGQIVITGKAEAVRKANEALLSSGAKRAILLNVSGPFHSPFLKEAGEKLGRDLEKVTFNKLSIPYVSNVTGEYVDDIKYTKELLKQQVYSPVKWEQSVRCMIENGVDTFVEIGPGRTIGGFIRKIDKTVRHINISTVEDLKKLDDLR